MNRWVFGMMMLGIWLLGMFQPASAQTFSEWFRQKRMQQKYLLEQVAALRMYGQALKNGYELVGSGLRVVRELSDGEFSLHRAFISGLKRIGPLVSENPKIGELMAMQLELLRLFAAMERLEDLGSGRQLLASVRSGMFADCLSDLEALLELVSAGRLGMEDAQRLERLDGLYLGMRERLSMARDLVSELQSVAKHSQNEKIELKRIGGWYGLED